jgi:hypothetical protein
MLRRVDGPVSGVNVSILQPFHPAEIARDIAISSWSPIVFGWPLPQGDVLGMLCAYLLQITFQNPWMSQLVLTLLPCWISTASMYFFCQNTMVTRSGLTREILSMVAALVYGYNWMTLQFLGMQKLAYAYSIFPLILLSSHHIFAGEGRAYMNALLLGLSLTFGTMWHPVAGIAFMVPFIVVGAVSGLVSSTSKSNYIAFGTSIVVLFLAFGIHVVLSLPFTLPVLVRLIPSGVADYAKTAGFVVLSKDWLAYLRPQIFRALLPTALSPFLLLTSPRAQDTILVVSGLFTTIIAFLPLPSLNRKTRSLSLSAALGFTLTAVMILLIKSESSVVPILYDLVPIMWSVNGPSYYIMIATGFLGISFALGLGRLSWKPIRLSCVRSVLVILIVGTIVLASAAGPLLSNNRMLFNPEVLSNGEAGLTYPSYVADLADRFNEEREINGPFRVLWVPQSNRVNILTVSYDIYSDFSLSINATRPALFERFDRMATAMRNLDTQAVGRELAILGFRYVVVLKDKRLFPGAEYVRISATGVDRYLTGDAANFERFLDSASNDFGLVERTPSYALYSNKVVPTNWYGMIWVAEDFDPLHAQGMRIVDMSPRYAATRYLVEIDASSLTWLVLAQNYDSGWYAYLLSEGGKRIPLKHSHAFGWSNAFLVVDSGRRMVLVVYEPQFERDVIIYVWFAGLVLVVAGTLGGQIAIKSNKFRQATGLACGRGCCRSDDRDVTLE